MPGRGPPDTACHLPSLPCVQLFEQVALFCFRRLTGRRRCPHGRSHDRLGHPEMLRVQGHVAKSSTRLQPAAPPLELGFHQAGARTPLRASSSWKTSKIGEVGGMEEVETASKTLAPLPSLALPAPEAGQEPEQQKLRFSCPRRPSTGG